MQVRVSMNVHDEYDHYINRITKHMSMRSKLLLALLLEACTQKPIKRLVKFANHFFISHVIFSEPFYEYSFLRDQFARAKSPTRA